MPPASAPPMPHNGTTRSPTKVWLVSAATIGIAAVVHHHLVNRELRDFGVEVRPWVSTLALVPGALLVVPALVTFWRTSTRIAVAQETSGLHPSARGPVGAVAAPFLLFAPYHQRELNRVWEVDQ